jgi:hypothetical protein
MLEGHTHVDAGTNQQRAEELITKVSLSPSAMSLLLFPEDYNKKLTKIIAIYSLRNLDKISKILHDPEGNQGTLIEFIAESPIYRYINSLYDADFINDKLIANE